MRYTFTLLVSTAIFAIASFILSLVLSPALIPAEYWVREMIVVKRDIAKKYSGQKKIIIASGSNTLFSIDTNQLTKELNIPVINYGLHAGLPLRTVLKEAAAVAESGDTIILPLEPSYYCSGELTNWQIKNIIAWDHEIWRDMPLLERIKAMGKLGPSMMVAGPKAKFQEIFYPEKISKRIFALDEIKVLAKFSSSPKPKGFAYSAYHLDAMGNMQNNIGTRKISTQRRADIEIKICAESFQILKSFKENLLISGVEVFFANTPFIDTGDLDMKNIEVTSRKFNEKISQIGIVLDTKSQLIFSRDLFFNTDFHMNVKGRRKRTSILAKSIRSNSHLFARIHSE